MLFEAPLQLRRLCVRRPATVRCMHLGAGRLHRAAPCTEGAGPCSARTVLHRHRGASTPGCTGTEVQARCLVPRFQVPHRVKSGKLTGSHIGGVAAGVHPVGGTNLRRANGGAVPARTQRSLKNRGPGRLGCGRPRLPRLHRDRGRPTTRGALRRVLTRRALGHWQTSPALASKPRGARYLDRGTTRWNSRAPARQGPSPEERHPVYPQRFNWFESTPRNAPRLPIQTNNHATSEPHTHVMSMKENKFP